MAAVSSMVSAMDDIPENEEAVGVKAKEIQQVILLRRRLGMARLVIGPFMVLYILLICLVLQQFVQNKHPNIVLYGMLGAAVLHVLAILFTVVPHKFSGSSAIVPLEFRQGRDLHTGVEHLEVAFEFRKLRFTYHPDSNTFERLRFPVHEPFEYYLKATGYGTADKVAAAVQQWGLNQFEVPVPPFAALLKEQMLAPFFVFQVFCVGLWCLDEYWYYSLFTLGMLVMFECTVVMQRQRNLRELHSLQTPKQRLQVYRAGKWEEVPGEALLPGDIVSIARPKGGAGAEEKVVPADCLLLAGNCIVEEAVLTGESTPQWKLPVGAGGVNPMEHLHIKSHRQHVLFGGTRMLQHTGDKSARLRTPDGGCLCVVLRTGFETSQGQLMRTILYSTERITANSWETGLFIMFLLVFAVSASYYVLKNSWQDPKRDRFKLILNCIMIITSVIPPELPMELTIAVNSSLVALARKLVFCTEPFRIPFAGKVQVCCFDKTGTLTTDHLLLEGLAGLPGRDPLELVLDPSQLPVEAGEVLACCQSLVVVDNELIGDPLEKAALQSSRWSYSSDVAMSHDRKTRATVLQRYHFSSHLRRMAAIIAIENEDATQPVPVAVMKGAPEVVRQHLRQVPDGYDPTYKHFAAQGARVIALARRQLPSNLSMPELRSLSREEVEADMDFQGFAVFQCPLKVESEPTLASLSAANHMLVMITGDAPLTAVHAASQVHIVTRPVLVMQHRLEAAGEGGPGAAHKPGSVEADLEYEWATPNERLHIPFSRSWEELLLLAAEYDLCLTGDALSHIEAVPGLGRQVIPLVQVFARVSPEQKELVLQTLRGSGWVTLMCGDGTNDVGGLKAAHVGVALLAPSALAEKQRKKGSKEKDGEAGDRRKKSKHAAAAAAAAGGAIVPHTGARAPPASQGSELAVSSGARDSTSRAGKGKKAEKLKPGAAMLQEYHKAGRPVPPSVERMATFLDSMDSDASMASPFTAKAASVAPVLDILKQGRCTLVTTVQMFKILGLSCLSTAYALSVMYLQGVKLSDAQLLVQSSQQEAICNEDAGEMSTGAVVLYFIATEVNCTWLWPESLSVLLGQFAVQLAFLIFMYRSALAVMPVDEKQDSESDFKPNLVNSVCYLVQQIVQLTTFAVNYVGHPFMTGIVENQGMQKSLTMSGGFLLLLMSELMPPLNESFGLVAIPVDLRIYLMIGAVLVIASTFIWEHLLRRLFPAPKPPSKGYMVYPRQLDLAQAKKLRVKKVH
eukprot:gene5162-5400_t